MRILFRVVIIGLVLSGAAFLIQDHEKAERLVRRTAAAVAGYLFNPEAAMENALRPCLEARLERGGFAAGDAVFIRIFKEEAILELWLERSGRYERFETYPICRWSGELGPKLKEGDGQSPEGFYEVRLESLNPNSRYHLSFNLGFPNAFDRAHARTGSYLMVHGGCSSVGCYAMTNPGIDEIYRLTEAALQAGQDAVAVHIFPFRMTEERMARPGRAPAIGTISG